MTTHPDDARIRKLQTEINRLKDKRMKKLPPCSSCKGKGETGDRSSLWSICSVCRGTKVDQGALIEARKKWGDW